MSYIPEMSQPLVDLKLKPRTPRDNEMLKLQAEHTGDCPCLACEGEALPSERPHPPGCEPVPLKRRSDHA